MSQAKFIFSLVRDKTPTKGLKAGRSTPVSTNLTPLRIRVKPGNWRRRGTKFPYVPKSNTQWPKADRCYMQLWELDKWRRGREDDTSAAKTGNELVKEIPGFIKQDSPKVYRFVADGEVKSAAAPKGNKAVTLMIDTLAGGKVMKKKVSLKVPGEAETCFELGVACETGAGQKKYTNNFKLPVYHILAHDDCICYLSDAGNPAARCGTGRVHYYIEAWMGGTQYGKQFYKFRYKNMSNFSSLGSVQSLEELIRALGRAMSTAANKNNKIGDLIILTHGITYYVNKAVDTVKIKLNLFDPSGAVPMGGNPDKLDAAEINNLMDSSHSFYQHVEGGSTKKGLISVVMKGINTHVDKDTHIWLAGCNLGLNDKLMKAVRALFDDKPSIYAFKKTHFLRVWTKGGNVTRGRETLVDARKRHTRVWTSPGVKDIAKVP